MKAVSADLGDSTDIAEMDAALLIFGEKGGKEESMDFGKIAERKWCSAPDEGDRPNRVNTGLNASPHYDTDLKSVLRFTSLGSPWINVHVLRLEPETLTLAPIR